MEQKTQVATKEERAIVQFRGEPITITFSDVRNYICPLASAQEVVIFLKTCQSLNLNPWANECFLIKYSERDKAATVISIEAFLKAAEVNPSFDGFEAGTILKDSGGKLELREGSFLLDNEKDKLVGGFARVWRKDRSRPYYVAVNKAECLRYTKDGHLTQFWVEAKQPLMLRKVALKRALVEAFPSLFSGAIANVDYEVLREEVKELLPEPKGETPEGELPSAFVKDGEPDWSKFWAHQAERGIDGKRVHALLKVSSIKADLFERGKTLEEIDQMISDSLEWEETIGVCAPTPAKEEEKPIGVPAPTPKEEPKPKPKRDPNSLKTLPEAFKALHEDCGVQPKQIHAELHVSSMQEITLTPPDVYRQIAAVYAGPEFQEVARR